MNEKSNIQIENSFTLKFRNTTNYTQQVTLFKEGLNPYLNSSIVKQVFGATAIDQFTTIPTFNTAFITNYIGYQNYSPVPFINYYPTIDNIFWVNNGSFNFVFDDLSGFTVTGITNGMSLAEVNQKIQEGFASSPVARNSLGQYCTCQIVIDTSVYKLYPLPIDTSNFSASFGISITYPYPAGLDSGKLLDIVFFNGQPLVQNISNVPLALTTEANGVTISDLSNITYEEILQSQNGSALQIESLSLNIGATPTNQEKESQLLQPFQFTKRDVNGNEIEIFKNQLIDPYQDQYSYSKVDLVEEENGEEYILDGNTGFTYRIEPLTDVFITYNYRKVSNSTFQKEEGSDELEKDDENIEILSKETEYANVYELDNVPISKKKIVNKTNWRKILLFIAGGYALYLLTKTNQK